MRPLLGDDGRHWSVSREGFGAASHRAWAAWAETVVKLCRDVPADERPLAGLPRRMDVLEPSHERLLAVWRRTAWRRWWRPALTPDGWILDWLGRVQAAGLLPAYLFYSYLHPELLPPFRAWQAANPTAMGRFLREFVRQPFTGAGS